MNDKALAIREDIPLMDLGNVLARSGFFQDTKDAGQAIVKVLAGRELGFGPIASMTGVYIIKGKVALSANLMAAAIKRSGRYNYRVKVLTDTECTIEFSESGQPCGTSTFTAKDAAAAGLGGDNWRKFPRNMLFARALSNGAKWYCPDLSGGPLYTPDELGANIDGDTGEVVDIEPAVIHQQPAEYAQEQSADVAPFRNPQDAVDWGYSQGCFKAPQHAANAYQEIKETLQPRSANEMARLWREDVARRLEGKLGLVDEYNAQLPDAELTL